MVPYGISNIMGNMDSKIREFLTPQQIADELQLNVLTVYMYIRHGELSAIRLGRNYRISRDDFRNFLKVNKTAR